MRGYEVLRAVLGSRAGEFDAADVWQAMRTATTPDGATVHAQIVRGGDTAMLVLSTAMYQANGERKLVIRVRWALVLERRGDWQTMAVRLPDARWIIAGFGDVAPHLEQMLAEVRGLRWE
jgi:hypothetical protein